MAAATPDEILEAAGRVLGATPITLTDVIAALEDAGLDLGPNARAHVIDALERVGIVYMIAGSFASNFHGVPRMNKWADDLGVRELLDRAGRGEPFA